MAFSSMVAGDAGACAGAASGSVEGLVVAGVASGVMEGASAGSSSSACVGGAMSTVDESWAADGWKVNSTAATATETVSMTVVVPSLAATSKTKTASLARLGATKEGVAVLTLSSDTGGPDRWIHV